MNKILLLSTSFEDISLVTASHGKKKGVKTGDDTSHYPLGIAYLHSYLEKDGYQVKSLFLNNHEFSYCLKKIKITLDVFKPDFVGLQILTPNRISSFDTVEYLHKNHPNIKIIIGGIHTTVLYESILKKYPYVIAVLGEGEITLSKLLNELDKNQPDLNMIAGIAFANESNEIIKTTGRALIENLDELPFPKHEEFITPKSHAACIITSRGCPFNCSFCCLDKISQRRVRKRSVKNIIDEILYIQKKLPNIKSVWIHDDTFFIDNRRVIEFCNEIIKNNIKLNFTCSGRLRPISEEMVKKMEEANFHKVLLGLESGNREILKKCKKGIAPEDAVNAFRIFADKKMAVLAFLIVGLPGETMETIKETGRLIQKLQKIKYVYYPEDVAVLTIYPGTEVYEITKASGKINDDFWFNDVPTPLFTLEHSQERLFRFKEVLLSYISLNRLITPIGLIRQLSMIPTITKYLKKNPSTLKILFIKLAKRVMPNKIYSMLKNYYKSNCK